MFEVFDPRDGVTRYRTKHMLLALLVCLFRRDWDFAYEGEGWIEDERWELT